ncbi:uncharacterized protein [Acropora muricata]|uniref:uncharacterized protein isoform X1 n=1 Tax=Acropora muricata TaxID=159855 RepID=UPI0034E4764F
MASTASTISKSARSPSATSSEISAAMLLVSLPTPTVDNSVMMSPPGTAKGPSASAVTTSTSDLSSTSPSTDSSDSEGEAKNDYTAAIVGGSITGVALIHVSQIKKGWFSKSQLRMNEMARHFYSKVLQPRLHLQEKNSTVVRSCKVKEREDIRSRQFLSVSV